MVASMSRTITLTLILMLLASGISLISLVSAQSNYALYAPQFTVTYMDNSYDVKPVYGVDQYTGETMVKTSGYHVQNASVVVKIKNQPFNSYFINESQVSLHYRISVKGHFGDHWQDYTYYFLHYGEYTTKNYIESVNNEDNTIVIFGLSSNNGSGSINGPCISEVDIGGKIDFKVQAYTAYFTQVKNAIQVPGWNPNSDVENVVSTSGWSNTQTITLGCKSVTVSEATPSPSALPSTADPTQLVLSTQNPSATPIQPSTKSDVLLAFTWERFALAIACIGIAVLAAAIVLSRRRRL
jgi:hypothetical protein